MNETLKNVLTTVTGVALAFIVLHFIQPVLVSGESMYPYLENNDYLIMDKSIYKYSDPEYGDIVVFPREDRLLIKRVIGKPNDSIEIKEGQIYRNGEKIEDYTDAYTEPDMTVDLGSDEYFCLGDNRGNSLDSRDSSIGNVKKSEIRGKASFRLFHHFGKI